LTVLEFNYLTIQLNQLNWRDFLKRKNPVAAALMSKMKIDPADRPKVKLECLRAIVTLKLDPARTSLLSWFVDSYLTLNPVEKLEFQAEVDKIKPKQQKEQVMQMVTSWMEEGIEKGIEQGIEMGEQQASLKMVRQVLLRRVGAIDPEVDRHLQSLSVEQLEALHDAALDFTALSDLLNWLN
jgi:flagellar biosynthesis/type III secretory pathway protein FliH